MNWSKIFLAGLVGGVLATMADFVTHAIILGGTYMKYPDVFTQTQTNPVYFFVTGILIAIFAALLFSKTRKCWADGWKGGATYGFFLGLVMFFAQFYNAMVIEGFPYFLSWCHGGSVLISATIMGLGIGLVLKN